MSPDDIHLIELLTGPDRTAHFSEGYIQEGKVTVTSGPLKGLEDKICRIDRAQTPGLAGSEARGKTGGGEGRAGDCEERVEEREWNYV